MNSLPAFLLLVAVAANQVLARLNSHQWGHSHPAGSVRAQTRVRDQDDDHIDFVNQHFANKTGGWRAARTSLSGFSSAQKKSRAGTIIRSKEATLALNLTHVHHSRQKRATIPATFDWRTNSPSCLGFRTIRNQENCGCCWAFAGAEVITDRICIVSGSVYTYFQASPQDINSCNGYGDSCNGGYTEDPYLMFQSKGVVTGGDDQSNSGCKPYTDTDVACTSTCSNTGYSKTYASDKAYGNAPYTVGNYYATAQEVAPSAAVIASIQTEIMTNGPLTVQFEVYEDFYNYVSGVYTHVTGGDVGGHAVKVLGWGTLNGEDYWLLANSWGTGWGLAGFVYFRKGINHLGIEDYMVASIPVAPTTTTAAAGTTAAPPKPTTVTPATTTTTTTKTTTAAITTPHRHGLTVPIG